VGFVQVCVAHEQAVGLMGELPPGVSVEVGAFPSDRSVQFWVPGFGRPTFALDGMPQLRVVQLLSAGADAWVGRLPSSVTLCDARGVHTSSVAEWVSAAVLGYLREFPHFARSQAAGVWAPRGTDELAGKTVLVVGAGDIGEAIAARLVPFEVTLVRVARSERPGVHPVSALPRLVPAADIVVLVVPLTPETAGLVDAAFLSSMKDGALLVNAARGPVVDTQALVAELGTGRIGAALDVVDPEPLPAGHPLWSMPNVLLTPHVGGAVGGMLGRGYRLAGDQLRRYVAGQPLVNVVTGLY
jgi:phosphoglycerate dehydrogenase-like enzyme